jgi:hypothetical protein
MAFNITHKRGDTWKGLILEVLLNGSPLDLTDATIRMQVKKDSSDDEALLEFTTVNDTVIIGDAPNGLFEIPETIVDLFPRVYQYDIEIITTTGRVITPFDGTFTITSDVTR